MAKTNNAMPMEVSHPAATFSNPVAASTAIRRGALVALDAEGNVILAAPDSPAIRGVALRAADNTGGPAGAITVETRRGCFILKNNGSLTRAHIGQPAYVVDDETVGATGTLVAGKCLDILTGGVAVDIT